MAILVPGYWELLRNSVGGTSQTWSQILILKRFGLSFPPKKDVHRDIPLAEASARIQLAILTSVFTGHTLSSCGAGTPHPFYR